MICCNTMHTAAAQLEQAAKIPLLHIADPLGAAIRKAGCSRPALLGSEFTMERDDILRGRLRSRFGIEVMTPKGADADEVSRVIYEELVRGQFLDSSRKSYREIIARLVAEGADSVILGCTELPLLVMPERFRCRCSTRRRCTRWRRLIWRWLEAVSISTGTIPFSPWPGVTRPPSGRASASPIDSLSTRIAGQESLAARMRGSWVAASEGGHGELFCDLI